MGLNCVIQTCLEKMRFNRRDELNRMGILTEKRDQNKTKFMAT